MVQQLSPLTCKRHYIPNPVTSVRKSITHIHNAIPWDDDKSAFYRAVVKECAIRCMDIALLDDQNFSGDCEIHVKEMLGISSPAFLDQLLEQETSSVPVENGLVVYFEYTARVFSYDVLHVGIVQGSKVRSRWGINGPLILHDIFHVPVEYGDSLFYFGGWKDSS